MLSCSWPLLGLLMAVARRWIDWIMILSSLSLMIQSPILLLLLPSSVDTRPVSLSLPVLMPRPPCPRGGGRSPRPDYSMGMSPPNGKGRSQGPFARSWGRKAGSPLRFSRALPEGRFLGVFTRPQWPLTEGGCAPVEMGSVDE